MNNNNKHHLLGPPLHTVVYFGLERSRNQAALKNKDKKERGKDPSLFTWPSSSAPDLGESSTVRSAELWLPLPLRSQPPAPLPSLKRGRGGPGPAGRRRGATPPTQPRRARSIVNKPRGPSPSAAALQLQPRCQKWDPAQPHSARTHTDSTHTHGHKRSHASTLPHTHVETEEYSPWLWIIVVLLVGDGDGGGGEEEEEEGRRRGGGEE